MSSRFALHLLVSLSCVIPLACGSSNGTGSSSSGSATSDAGSDSAVTDGSILDDASARCPRMLRAEDADRFIAVSHPFDAASKKDKRFELLKLTSDGTITRSATFETSYTFEARVVFTPDGKLGFIPHDDGSLGVFAISEDGQVTVLQSALRGPFYAARLQVSEDGSRLFVLDTQTPNNGGGLYELRIGCDGTLGAAKKLGEADAMGAFAPIAGDRFFGGAGAAFGDKTHDTFTFGVSADAAVSVQAATTVFRERTIVTDTAVSSDGKLGVLACGNSLAGGSQVVAVSLGATLEKRNTLTIESASSVVASPFGNAFLLTTSDPDSVRVLAYDATNTAAPLSLRGELAYRFGRPQLPTSASVISRGKLKGRVLMVENVAVRQVQFQPDGTAVDTAKFSFGEGLEAIVGAMGVTP